MKLSEGITSLQENPGKVRIAAGINSKEDNVMSHFNDLCQINREAEENALRQLKFCGMKRQG